MGCCMGSSEVDGLTGAVWVSEEWMATELLVRYPDLTDQGVIDALIFFYSKA